MSVKRRMSHGPMGDRNTELAFRALEAITDDMDDDEQAVILVRRVEDDGNSYEVTGGIAAEGPENLIQIASFLLDTVCGILGPEAAVIAMKEVANSVKDDDDDESMIH